MALDTVLRSITDYLNRSEPIKSGLLLSGGGARAAYQAGVLRYIADAFPGTEFPILTGVSAGAINAAHLATGEGGFAETTERLVSSWNKISPDQVYSTTSNLSFLRHYLLRRGGQDGEGIHRALLDTDPLRQYLIETVGDAEGNLSGIDERIRGGLLDAVAVVATNYATGQTVTWVHGGDIPHWERPMRVGVNTRLGVEHIMASTSLPVIFPAINIGETYFGDGGIRLSAPLAPVVHLGANRILAISTRYSRSQVEADTPTISGYPQLGQIASLLMNSVFLDALDQDAHTMDRINALLDQLPARKRLGLRQIELLVLRPSIDLGKLAGEFEPLIRGPLKLISRILGGSSISPDWLSMLLFEEGFISRLIDTGYKDGRDQRDRIAKFLDRSTEDDARVEASRLTG
jgi:NTE family protein